MQNDHINCDCWECTKTQHYAQLNDFNEESDHMDVEQNDTIAMVKYPYTYKKMDGTYKTVQKPKAGKVVYEVMKNDGKTLQIANAITKKPWGYLPNDQSYFTIEGSSSGSGIIHQIVRDTEAFVKGNPLSVKVKKGAEIAVDTSKNIVHGVEDVASASIGIISFAGKNLKWILIALGILVAAYFGFQFYAATKTIRNG